MKQTTWILTVSLSFMTLGLANCAGTGANSDAAQGSVIDDSTSGSVAGAIGGALSNSEANGTQASMSLRSSTSFVAYLNNILNPVQKAYAESFCPTYKSTGSDCMTSASSMWLSYNSCTFSGNAEWNGVQEITMSSGTAACGSFPNPGDNGTLYRQFVEAAGGDTPGSVTLTAGGAEATVDTASANLANFDGDTIAAFNPNGGYGSAVAFNASDARDSVTVGAHISVVGDYDHSISGTVSVDEQPGAHSRTVAGSVLVYHNLMQVIGTSTFNNVVHEDICCLPVSGSITTTFAAGSNPNTPPTQAGAKLVGKTETLTFTGCGTAILQSTDGAVKNVILDRCF